MNIGEAGCAAYASFVGDAVAVVVDVVAVVVVGSGFFAESPGCACAEVAAGAALAGLAGCCFVAGVEPILVCCVAVALVVDVSTVV